MAGKIVALSCWLACLVFLVNVNEVVPTQPGPWSQLAMVLVPMLKCGDNLCDCQGQVAYCSTQESGPPVSYLPGLPAGITDVRFNRNGLTSQMMNNNFFVNVSSISALHLVENNLTVIRRSTFKVLKNLNTVYVSKNRHLTLNSLKVLLNISTLHVLFASECSLGQLPSGFFNGVQSPVKQLWLNMNNLHLLNLTDFSHLRELLQLDVSSNAIHDIIPDRLTNLLRLVLTNNTLAKFPITCRNGVSLFPKLKGLLLENNHFGNIGPDICLPELTNLDVSRNAFDILDALTFSVTKFPKLKALFFCCQHMQFPLQDYAFNNTSLVYLNFAKNNVRFLSQSLDDIRGSPVGRYTHLGKYTPYIRARAFQNCTNLSHLILDNNDFGDIDDDILHQLFGHLPLTNLSIKHGNFHSITPRTFSKFPLLRSLNLMGNKITSIPEGAFDSLKKLRDLDLSSNRIASVHHDSFSEAMRTQLRKLSLRKNPFICNCDLLWFKGWLQSSYTLFDADSNNGPRDHMCANVPGTNVTDFSMEEQACLLSVAVSVQVILTCSLLIVALTSSSLVFRYRWYIRLLLYEAFRGRDDVRRRLLETGNFRYDVFVSYASEQLPWIRQHLLPELEDRLGLKVCDHERDFIPGKNILDNIADCLESSKKMVMVFSKDFVISEWCQFELAVCLRHAMDHDDAPVIVCIDDVTSRNMTSAMIAVLKFTTYIQWEEEAHAVDSFWGRLHLALNDIVQQRNLDRQL